MFINSTLRDGFLETDEGVAHIRFSIIGGIQIFEQDSTTYVINIIGLDGQQLAVYGYYPSKQTAVDKAREIISYMASSD